MRRKLVASLLLAAGCSAGAPTLPAVIATGPPPVRGEIPGLHRAVELTTHTADDSHPVLSPDGQRLLFVSDRSGQPDLWLKSLDGGATRGAVRVTWHTAIDSDPAWAPDGRRIAFTSHREDPDGDIYTVRAIPLLSSFVGDRLLWQRGTILERRTRSDRADRSPVYHPDGERILFTSRLKGAARDEIRILDLDGEGEARDLTTEGGHDPDVAPDGDWIAFAAARGEDPTDHDLFALRLSDGVEVRLSRGRGLDAQPSWSPDGSHLLFTRFDDDTDGDGRLTPSDRGSLYRLDIDTGELERRSAGGFDDELPIAVPLTAADANELFPTVVGDHVVFATNRLGRGRGPLDIAALPLAGLVQEHEDATLQAAQAEALGAREGLSPEIRRLGYRKVLRPFAEAPLPVLRERAQERIGTLLLAEGDRREARRSFEDLVAWAPESSANRALARIEILRIDRLDAQERFRSEAERHRLDAVLDHGLEALGPIAASFPNDPVVAVRVHLEHGRHELAKRERLRALEDFRDAEARAQSFGPQLAAEAAYERGRVYAAVGDSEGLIGSDLNMLERYGEIRPFAGDAADRIVATTVDDLKLPDEASRLAAIRRLVDQHPTPAVLPARALLELGRRHMTRGEAERAEVAYRRVETDFPEARPELARARLALADLYHTTGRDEAAIEEYLALQRDLPEAERAYEIARESYIRRSLERGRRSLAQRDPQQAIAIFVTLVKYDEDIVEAHRGLVEAYAATGRADEIEAHYREQTARRPSSAVARYALGLALTYSDPGEHEAAEESLRAAIALDARLSFAHQTLGYILEQRAGEAGIDTRPGRALLDQARDSYLTAMALTDGEDDPARRADLELNLGNVMYRLGNYRRALESYRARAASEHPFAATEQEALFRMSYGESAQKMGALEEARTELEAARALWIELERPEQRYQVVDLLGLVHQQRGRHLEAVESYREALTLSRLLGDGPNARMAMRNIAVNLSFAAEPGTGVVDWRLLEEALSTHEETLVSLEGDRTVATRRQGPDGAGLSVRRLDVALSGDASRAAFGFDAEGERQLALSFIARMYREAGHPEAAIQALERKRAGFPEIPEGADATFALTDRAILDHQLGVLRRESGNLAGAFDAFRSSLGACLRLPAAEVAIAGVSLNLDYLALLARDGDPTTVPIADLEATLASVGPFLGDLDPARHGVDRARMLNSLAVANRAIALREDSPGEDAAAGSAEDLAATVRASLAQLERSGRRLDRSRQALRDSLEILDPPIVGERAPRRRLRATVVLNLEAIGTDDETAAVQARIDGALSALRPGIDDDLRWRLLVARARPTLSPVATERVALLEQARGLLEQAPPGLHPAAERSELLALYGELARMARDDGDLDGALEALDWIPALGMRAALARSALAGSVPLADGNEADRMRWSDYWAAVLELQAARRGDAGSDGAGALARMQRDREVPSRTASAVAPLFDQRPLPAGDAQARLPSDSVLIVTVRLPGEAGPTRFRMTPSTLELASDEADAARGASRIYLSPRSGGAPSAADALAPLTSAPTSTVHSLAHLAWALDGRNVLRSGHLVVTGAPPSTDVGPRTASTELTGGLADRMRVRAALPGHPIVELALPWVGRGDLLGARWLLPGDPNSIRPFTLGDLIDVARRHRVLFVESMDLPAASRATATELLAFAGFPTVIEASSTATRARIVDALELESAGRAAAEARSLDASPRVFGAIGFDADEAIAFAEERYETVLTQAARLYAEERWSDAAGAFAEALSLEAILDRPEDRARILLHLTESHARSGEIERAAHFQTLAVADSESLGDPAPLAENLFYLGVFRSRAEHYAAAEEALLRSARLYEEIGEAGRASEALATRGIAQENDGRYGEALESFHAALGIDREGGDAVREGRELRRIGRIQLVRLHRHAAAKDSFERAREILAEAGDAEGWIESTLELGLVREATGDLVGARDFFDEGIESAQDFELPELVGKGILYRAQTHWLAGDYTRAFQDLRESGEIAELFDDAHLAYLVRNLTVLVRWSLNDHDRALEAADQAMEMAVALEEPAEIATVHNNRGIVLRDSGRAAAALEELQRALTIDREIASRWGEGYDLRNIGMTYLELDRPETARSHLAQAREVSRSIGDRVNEAKAVVSLGDALLDLGRPTEALEAFEDARRLSLELGVLEVQWRAEWGAGRALAALERGDAALESLVTAVDTVEGMRASLALEEMRNGFITNKVDLYEDLILELLDRDEPVRAFEYAERSRARGFIDLLGNARVEPANRRSRELLQRVGEVETQLAAARTLDDPTEREREVTRLDDERRDLLAEIQLADPELTSFVSVPPLDAAGVQALLDDGTALLAYFVTEGEVIVWTVQASDLSVVRVPIGREELVRRVAEFRARIQAIEPLENEARALYDLLVRPALGPVPEEATLGMVPHGRLHYLSFAALSDGEAYLVERHPVFYTPSASVLSYLQPMQRKAPGQLRVLAIGNPDLGTRDFDLPFSEKEVRSLRWTYPKIDILTGAEASKEWLLEHARDYDVIHLASHGEFDPIHPLASALKLAQGTSEGDGDLTAAEVFGLELDAELVTLSACQTGLGSIEAGDEVIGMNRAFLYAGTPSLLSTLWRVSDVSTAVLIKHFYRNYDDGNRAQALRRAQLHVMSYYPHPSYWAGFTLTGDHR